MRTRHAVIGLFLLVGTTCALGLFLLPALAHASPAALPPRPATSTPTPDATATPATIPTEEPVDGASIVLQVTFGDDWPARGLAWQELWTAVEWQDEEGVWHVVRGWQGELDEVDGETGWKVWWLPESLFGRGPFRWVVAERQGGAVVARSEPFDLPLSREDRVVVEVSVSGD